MKSIPQAMVVVVSVLTLTRVLLATPGSSAYQAVMTSASTATATGYAQLGDVSRPGSPLNPCECRASVAVQVTENGTAAGTPVAGVFVQLRSSRGVPQAMGITDDNGVATMEQVPGREDYAVWVLQTPDSEGDQVSMIPNLSCSADVYVVVPRSPDLAVPTTPATVTPIPTATLPPAPTPMVDNIEVVSQMGGPGSFVQDIYVTGNYAYLAELCGASLWVVDISDPANPVGVSLYDGLDFAYAVHVVGDYAYIADGDALRVIDVSDPATPHAVGFVDTPGWVRGIYVAGNYAYVADESLHIVDISNPREPTIVGVVPVPAEDVHVSGDYAYVAAGHATGLRIIDVSDPVAPVPVGFVNTRQYTKDVFVAGDYAYVISHDGLHVIDISEPTAPIEAGFLAASYACPDAFFDRDRAVCEIYVANGYAYVAGGTTGMHVVDVSDPTTPVEVSFYTPGSSSNGVYAADAPLGSTRAYVYLAGGERGLLVLRFGPISTTPSPTRPVSPTTTPTATVTLTPVSTPTATVTPTTAATPEPAWHAIYLPHVKVSHQKFLTHSGRPSAR